MVSTLQFYGVRTVWAANDKKKAESLQIIGKAPSASRQELLERSGLGDLFVRDFLSLEEAPQDTTIIPRFWAITKQGKDEALRSASSLTGYAGLALVKRGISVRGWCSKITDLRKVLMAGDDRYNDANSIVIPRKTLTSTGWPLSASAYDVTRAVASACGQAPIPMRCSKSMGVNTWTLGFQVLPSVRSFTAMFNATTYEILLSEIQPSGMRPKFAKSVKPQENKPVYQPAQSSDVTHRLTTLESKMSAVERRQDNIENKLDNGFGELQDQLRRVLQAVQPPRPTSPLKTGLTPPTKAQRQQ